MYTHIYDNNFFAFPFYSGQKKCKALKWGNMHLYKEKNEEKKNKKYSS
jgi:hypothetical protein